MVDPKVLVQYVLVVACLIAMIKYSFWFILGIVGYVAYKIWKGQNK